jgi:hypothetical protein
MKFGSFISFKPLRHQIHQHSLTSASHKGFSAEHLLASASHFPQVRTGTTKKKGIALWGIISIIKEEEAEKKKKDILIEQ